MIIIIFIELTLIGDLENPSERPAAMAVMMFQ